MAIVLHSNVYNDIKIDSNMIIGVMGEDYYKFLKSLKGNEIYYVNYIESNKIVEELVDSTTLDELEIDKEFLNKRVNNLSHSENKLLGYLRMLNSEAKIIVINEPFIDLDYHYKKILKSLFNRLVKTRTIIIGSKDSNIIYSLCKKVLLLGNKKYVYDKSDILANKRVLKSYHLEMPQILEFIRLAEDKRVKLPYSRDIRDLIKDVYKHVRK